MKRSHRVALEVYERELLRLDRSPLTIEGNLWTLRRFLDWAELPVRRIDPETVRRYLARQAEQGLAATTQDSELSRLRSFFSALVRLGRLRADPTAGLAVGGARPREPVVLGTDAVRRLLVAASELVAAHPRGTRRRALALRDRALLEILYGLGLRASEATASRVLDLDLAAGTLLARRAKRGRPAVLPLPPRALPALAGYLEAGRPLLCRPGRDELGHLFLSRQGRRLATTVVGHVVAKLAGRAGVRAHPHALRRSLATGLLRGGTSPVAVQWLLGHAELSTTAVYLVVDLADLRAAVDVLEAERARGGQA